MTDIVEIKLTGFKELGERLKDLGPKVARRGLRATAYAGARVIRNKAKQTTAWQDRSGLLRKNIVVAENRGRNIPERQATYSVRVRNAKSQKYANTKLNRRLRRVGKRHKVEGTAFYGKFLEYGTSRMSARPWLRPAFDSSTTEAIEAMRVRLGEAVEDAWNKQ